MKKADTKFDFESIYARYPRKEGKKRGMDALKKTILTPEDYQRFSDAVDKYCAICRRDRREDRYIKHWSTFVTSWEDYADQGTSPPPPSSPNADQLQRILKGEL